MPIDISSIVIEKGIPGASAYELAVRDGFVGTYADWALTADGGMQAAAQSAAEALASKNVTVTSAAAVADDRVIVVDLVAQVEDFSINFGDLTSAITTTEALRDQAAVENSAAQAAAETATTQAALSTTQSGLSAAAKTASEAAAALAFSNANAYATTAAGLAATTVGQQFQVASVDGLSSVRYRHDAGPVATAIMTFPVKASVDSLAYAQVSNRVSPEITLRNILQNGNFAAGVAGYTGATTITKAADGAAIRVPVYNSRLFYSPTINYTFAAGARFLVVYKFNHTNWIDGATVLALQCVNASNVAVTNEINVARVVDQVAYEGSAILTVTGGSSGSAIKLRGALWLSTGNEINLKHLMLIPLDGDLTGATQAEALAAFSARNVTGIYFEAGGAAYRSIRANRADIATTVDNLAITTGKLEADLQDSRLSSLITQPNLKLGQQGWTHATTGIIIYTWQTGGLHIDYTPASDGTAVFSVIGSQNIPLVAGRRYAFYVDMDLAGSGSGTTGLDSGGFKPFVNSATGAVFPEKRLKIGRNGQAITHRSVALFDAVTTQTAGKAYFRFGYVWRDPADQAIFAFDVDVDIRTFMLVDLGVPGDVTYSLSEDQIGDMIHRMGAPYYPSPPARVPRAFDSVRSVYAKRAELSDVSTLATVATLAETLRSTWTGKHLLTIGHSLVSQQGWQAPLRSKLGLSGFSVRGTPGGTIAPKPLNATPTPGFFSRSYVQSVISDCTNSDASIGLSGKTVDATIIWTGANDGIDSNFILQDPGLDRIMSIAEQDEFESRNTSAPSTPLSNALSTGLRPTYLTLYLTAIRNLIEGLGLGPRPEHRLFIVREPQAFHRYDGTLDWPSNHFEKNEIHKKVADYFGLPIIDLWNNSGINISTRGMFMSVEDSGNLMIHLNTKGGVQVMHHIAQVMMQHPPIDFTGISGGADLGFPTATTDLSPWNA